MKIYLAARYSRRLELLEYAADLERVGHEITSRWLQGSHQISNEGLSKEADSTLRERFASEDLADLLTADCCISFTEIPRSNNSRGGRHVEFGAALAKGLLMIVVGPVENVFHCLPDIRVYSTWNEVFETLKLAFEMEQTR